MGRRFDHERAATILVEALYYGDKRTAERWGITGFTIRRYRHRMNDDSKLFDMFQVKKQAFETHWAEEISGAIRSAVRFIARAGIEADPSDPAAIHAVAGALKLCAEISMTKAIIDARLAMQD